MLVLFIGDIIGRVGRKIVKNYLHQHIGKYDLVIANGENSAAGFGITDKVYRELLNAGVNIITGGNHTWDKAGTEEYIGGWDYFVRPANYPEGTLGHGFKTVNVCGVNITVLSLLGRVFMNPYDNPFIIFDKIYGSLPRGVVIIDFHAEATSEKNAFGFYVDGRASVVLGTHTHVQTNDLHIRPKGTLYLTDVGMCGSLDSVIGMNNGICLDRFTSCYNRKFQIEINGRMMFNGVEIEISNSGDILSYSLINIVTDGIIH